MKGLFPSAQLGASHLNAKKSGTIRGNSATTHVQGLSVLCTRCGESVNGDKLSFKACLAAGASLICFIVMLGACFIVPDPRLSSAYQVRPNRGLLANTARIALGTFFASATAHVAIACKALGMSLRRMLFWAGVGGSGAGLVTVLLLKWKLHEWARHGDLVVAPIMWAVLVALVAVYAAEAIRLEPERRQASNRHPDAEPVL